MKTRIPSIGFFPTARTLLFVVIFLLATAPVFAQGMRMSPEERKARFDADFYALKTSLVLDDESAPKVKEILWSQQEKMMETMAGMQGGGGNQLARDGMRQKMQEVNAATREQLAAILSAEQMEKYDAFQAERRRGPGQGQRGRRNMPQ